MAQAEFRFYEELNEFLAPRLRRRAFVQRYARNATVKHAVESLGVPHTEIELILVNGESVDFSRRLHDGDRVSVYPQFEALDVMPLLRVRARPLRETHFLVDAQLAGLARYLRMLGFDTQGAGNEDDASLVRRAVRERRVVLSRDRALLMRRELTHACFVRARRAREQTVEILRRLDLLRSVRPLTRCLRCNEPLTALRQAPADAVLPAQVCRDFTRFWCCRACRRVYWQGSHYRRMRALVDELLRAAAPSGGRG